MRWRNIHNRIAEWFAEAMASEDDALARRLARIAVTIRRLDAGCESRTLSVLLDELEKGELANLETRELAAAKPVPLNDVVHDLEKLLETLGTDLPPSDGRCDEDAVMYAASSSRDSKRRTTQ